MILANIDYISVWISIAINQSWVQIIDNNTSKLISEGPPNIICAKWWAKLWEDWSRFSETFTSWIKSVFIPSHYPPLLPYFLHFLYCLTGPLSVCFSLTHLTVTPTPPPFLPPHFKWTQALCHTALSLTLSTNSQVAKIYETVGGTENRKGWFYGSGKRNGNFGTCRIMDVVLEWNDIKK